MKAKKILINKLVFYVVTFLAVIASLFMIATTLTGYSKYRYITFHPNYLLFFYLITVSCILMVMLWYLGEWFAKRFTGWFVAFVGIMSIPKLILIAMFKLNPQSDMYSYSVLAGSRANGDLWSWMYHVGVLDLDNIFPHVLHIADFYNILFRISVNSNTVVQYFNVMISALTTFLVLGLAARFFGRRAGMFAALVFFLQPSWYLYTTLIGIEPVWLFCQLAGISLILRLFKYGNFKDWRLWGDIFLIIVVLFFAENIQPLSVVLFIAFFCFIWFRFHEGRREHLAIGVTGTISYKPRFVELWLPKIAIVLIIGACFTLRQIQPQIDRFYFGVPIASNNVGEAYTLAVGTNPKTHGVYSDALINRIELFNHINGKSEGQKFIYFNSVFKKQIKDNLNYHHVHRDWNKFVYSKYESLMKPAYAFTEFSENTRSNDKQKQLIPRQIVDTATNLMTAPVVALLLLVVIGLLSQLFSKKENSKTAKDRNGILLTETIMLGFFILFFGVEVQGRYQISFYIPWIFIGSLGMRTLMGIIGHPSILDEHDRR